MFGPVRPRAATHPARRGHANSVATLVLQPGDPVHDIGLRLAVDDTLTIVEAEMTMRSTPFPTCIEVEPILQRLVGERIGKGWSELVRRKIGRLET